MHLPSSNKSKSILIEVFEAVVGQPCVEVYGGCWGSHFSILFGRTKARKLEIKLRGKDETLDVLEAETELSVETPTWSLFRGEEQLCCAETESGHNSPMFRGLQLLIGQELTSVAIDDCLNLEMRFTNHFWLQVLCAKELESPTFNYSIRNEHQTYTVYEKARLTTEPRASL